MRAGPASGTDRYHHEVVLHGADEEFLAVVAPFVREGVAAGEPTIVALAEHESALLRRALPRGAGVSWLSRAEQYRTPASAIRTYREQFAEAFRAGVPQVRLVGNVPHHVAAWSGWVRYEAAVNQAFAALPVWSLCSYDTRVTPRAIIDDVVRTHPHLVGPDGTRRPNPGFVDPEEVLTERMRAPLPAEPGPAVLVLDDPSPAAARHALLGTAPLLDRDELEDLVLALSEVVDNAWVHGVPPVRVALWTGERTVVTVTDTGPGPSDPYAGLLPAKGSATAGLGLWMAHQLDREVTLHRGAGGFTVRMTAGPS
ncbi:MEDS domain-containing protein [Pseudonocardia sp. RS11V-5]|uniref:anti-sigma factor RsbA family regulatory protein n=1 Tax=Pseudonocardia terrae TaxID=2905831 RepID=UPI001E61FBF6|nr:anti-sigma factor RsbA family regulatory protein [Pseudonocardia terrae]MCE3552503.1 MEDS domain-containing protein [Pseudonocardia terrae]